MLTLITSYGREDLLLQTMESLRKHQQSELDIIIHEDHPEGKAIFGNIKLTHGLGQHVSIEKFLNEHDEKYYLHCEDDFEFHNSYDWISESVKIMEANPSIIKVLACKTTPHPCFHDRNLSGTEYGLIEPWMNTDSLWWCGWSFNPGVTRMDLLKQFIPFPRWEQDLGLLIHNAGYKVAELKNKIYHHIGDDRSTHHKKK